MKWAVQTTLINTQQALSVTQALKDRGIEWVAADTLPFSDSLVEEIAGDEYIPYGSTTLMKIALKRGWKGLAFDPDYFQVDAWINNRTDMLNQCPYIMTVGEAQAYFKKVKPDTEFFVRPVGDLKLFNGTATTAKELTNWMGSIDSGNFSFTRNDQIAISQIQVIDAEWRFFIVGRNIIDGSMYRCDGRSNVQHETNKAILNLAKRKVLEEWLPHENCVMDVALSGSEFKVIEFNCINASGFYDHDIPKILTALNRYYIAS